MMYSLLLAALSTLAAAQYPLSLLYQFPSPPAGQFVDIENVALRSTNGQLLLTTVTGPSIYQLNPAAPVPELIITLSAPVQGVLGIAETCPGSDVFAVVGGNYTVGPQVPGYAAGNPGSFYVFTVDLTGPKAKAKVAAYIPQASALNGLTAVPGDKDLVLVADSGLGAIWSVNVKTGAYKIAIQDPQFLPTANFSIGINGIHIQDSVLYWTNSALNSFGKVPIGMTKDGHVAAAGAVQQIASTPPGYYKYDDFALDHKGSAWVATNPNAVTRVSLSGAVQIVAGGGNDTTILAATSTVFGPDGCSLYLVTGGQPFPPGSEMSGQVFKLDTCVSGKSWRA